jgi:hypothetical protein
MCPMLTGIWTKDFHQKYKTGRVGLKSACRVRLLLAHQASGNDDDYDVLTNGEVVGRIFKANAASVGSPWMWDVDLPAP